MENKSFGVNIFGFLTGEFGIGEATRLNCKAIAKVGLPLKLINYDVKTNHNHNDKTFQNFDKEAFFSINLIQMSASEEQVTDFFQRFDYENFQNRYNILYFAWESESLPESFLKNIYCFDEIWTPSHYCKSCFEKHVRIPITVIPHPIDIEINTEETNQEIFFDSNQFNFFSMFDYNSSMKRKNILNLIKAFKDAFEGWENNAFLTIKTSKPDKFKSDKLKLIEEIGDSKKIKIIEKILSKHVLNETISKSDCFVSLHLSEGYGLTMAEAMFFGKVVLATNYSGNLEFMNDKNSILINASKSILINEKTINYSEGIIWSEPSLSDAAQKMKHVYENFLEYTTIKENAKNTIKNDFNLDKIGNLIKQRLTEIFNNSLHVTPASTYIIKSNLDKLKLLSEIKIYRKSTPIQLILKIKMFFRNNKFRLKKKKR